MHTATRLALPVLERVRALILKRTFAATALYAPLNEAHLRNAGVQSIIGGEFEAALSRLADKLAALFETSLERLHSWCPTGPALPVLSRIRS